MLAKHWTVYSHVNFYICVCVFKCLPNKTFVRLTYFGYEYTSKNGDDSMRQNLSSVDWSTIDFCFVRNSKLIIHFSITSHTTSALVNHMISREKKNNINVAMLYGFDETFWRLVYTLFFHLTLKEIQFELKKKKIDFHHIFKKTISLIICVFPVSFITKF